jgi:hypothetical protein
MKTVTLKPPDVHCTFCSKKLVNIFYKLILYELNGTDDLLSDDYITDKFVCVECTVKLKKEMK